MWNAREPMRIEYKTGLGCGTLILIAMLILLLGNLGAKDLRRDVQQLKAQVEELRATVQAQTVEIRLLRASLEGKAPTKANRSSTPRSGATTNPTP